jgi:hypothetical protein
MGKDNNATDVATVSPATTINDVVARKDEVFVERRSAFETEGGATTKK